MSTAPPAWVWPHVLSELSGLRPSLALPYTWGGKGWGGPRGDGGGLDCSGFACGLLWRCGVLPHSGRTNTDGMLAWEPVTDPRPLDVALYGPSVADAAHVAVLGPDGRWYDAGGGGSRTYPGGPDWPTRGRAGRQVALTVRRDLLGFRRAPRVAWTEADRRGLLEWVAHVRAYREGRRLTLSRSLLAADVRPVWGL